MRLQTWFKDTVFMPVFAYPMAKAMMLPDIDCCIEGLCLSNVVRFDSEFLLSGTALRGHWYSNGSYSLDLTDVSFEGSAGWPTNPEVADSVALHLFAWKEESVHLTLFCLPTIILLTDGLLWLPIPRALQDA